VPSKLQRVTHAVKGIANLEDLTEIRSLSGRAPPELKTSIDRMTAEGKDASRQAQAEVTTYKTRLEEAEEIAHRDVSTGLGSRLAVEARSSNRSMPTFILRRHHHIDEFNG